MASFYDVSFFTLPLTIGGTHSDVSHAVHGSNVRGFFRHNSTNMYQNFCHD
ncbi:unnamed protein product [Sphenostylis stenocarpa]|uniref:Uncharacterized protein n=1 Tax=Sphenostylis stenocarpa TaxID=92480 RepID=A0AA86W5D0_9FABA|nr:unnamed protein product [Sphenostylis stenocarpa]